MSKRAWTWRKASGGVMLPTDGDHAGRLFHAYDVTNHAACVDYIGLIESCEEPNEGSSFCSPCMDIVRATPEGRPPA